MVSLMDKDIIFGLIEASLGLATAVSIAVMNFPCNDVAYVAIAVCGCLSGFVPVLMRWTLKFWQGGSLPKAPELVVCIWSIVCYLSGGGMTVFCIVDSNSKAFMPYIPAIFAVIVAVILLVDMIIGLL